MGTVPVGVDRKNTRNGLFRQKGSLHLKKYNNPMFRRHAASKRYAKNNTHATYCKVNHRQDATIFPLSPFTYP